MVTIDTSNLKKYEKMFFAIFSKNEVYENNESKNYNFSEDSTVGTNFANDNMHNGPLTWIDLDNDTDLDLIAIGTKTVVGILARVYINNNTILNTQPTFPTSNFSANYSSTNAILNLSWGNGSDSETNTSGLYYNLMIGNETANHTVISGVYGGSSGGGDGGGPSTGYFGNMMQRKSISLNINLSDDTYYWYVQTIDTGLAKSDWSSVQNFTVGTDATAPVITSVSSSVTSSTATIISAYIAIVVVYTKIPLDFVTLFAAILFTVLLVLILKIIQFLVPIYIKE